MKTIKRKNSITLLLVGIVFVIIGVALTIHFASYIFLGKTVDLNEVLKNGEEIPTDEVVSYTCEYPLGNYAEMQTYINGVIPTPFKSQLYAMIDEHNGKGLIFSAKLNRSNKIEEFDKTINGQKESVTVVGTIHSIDPESFEYLEQTCGDIEGDIVLSYYVIDTTNTRLSIIALNFFSLALGVFCLVTFFRKRN